MENTPKPRSSTRSPCARAEPICSNTTSTIRSISRAWRYELAAASRWINPDLVMRSIPASQPFSNALRSSAVPEHSSFTRMGKPQGRGVLLYPARQRERPRALPAGLSNGDGSASWLNQVPRRRPSTSSLAVRMGWRREPSPGFLGAQGSPDSPRIDSAGCHGSAHSLLRRDQAARRKTMPTKAKSGQTGPKTSATGKKPNALQQPLQPSRSWGGGWARTFAARRGGAQGLGVHQAARPAEPG